MRRAVPGPPGRSVPLPSTWPLPLAGCSAGASGDHPAVLHALELLALLGANVGDCPSGRGDGLSLTVSGERVELAVSGERFELAARPQDLSSPAAAISERDMGIPLAGVGMAIRLLARALGREVDMDAGQILARGRLTATGEKRRGPLSAGSCRLVRTADGWVAVNLASDGWLDLLPALVGSSIGAGGEWEAVERFASTTGSARLRERAQRLGIPVAAPPWHGNGSGELDAQAASRWGCWPPPAPWLLRGDRAGSELPEGSWGCREARLAGGEVRVVDTSALWAGPMVGMALAGAGCDVEKVELLDRRDPLRLSDPGMYSSLNGLKRDRVLGAGDWDGLRRLASTADIVITSGRPRAFENAGIHQASGQVWIAVTGYGQTGPWRDWVALGDDAGIAGGAVSRNPATGDPCLYGDAIGDPIAGSYGALAGLAAAIWLSGGHRGALLVDVAMREAVGFCWDRSPLAGAGT